MHEFLINNREEIIERCKAKVAQRLRRAATAEQLKNRPPLSPVPDLPMTPPAKSKFLSETFAVTADSQLPECLAVANPGPIRREFLISPMMKV